MSNLYALGDRFPGLGETLPRCPLATLPTPVAVAGILGRELNLDELLIKRDDISAPLYGGNKVRKLEYLLAHALRKSCDTVITFGAVGSNHALATSIYAHHLGLNCIAVLTDQPHTPNIDKTLRFHAHLGTRLIHAQDYKGSLAECDEIENAHPRGPDAVYRIPWGGSSWLGTVGFINAALELCTQLAERMPDVVYVACGTMGTTAGLALGFRMAGVPTRIEAIQVVPNVVTNPDRFIAMHRETCERLRQLDPRVPQLDDPLANVTIRTGFLGQGYAETTPQCVDAVHRIAATESVALETTYTGKALAALIADANAGRLRGKRVMFWNTYNSQPAPEGLDDVSIESIPDSLRHYLRAADRED